MTAAGLPSLRGRRSLREEITELLRAAVMAGELEPGVTYSAPSLAEQFGVSATPVREAMLDLEKEGLVEIVRNKGFRVTSPSPEELDDVTELRVLVEETQVGGLSAVVPTITGRAWVTGTAQYMLDPRDPFPEGFEL